MYYVFLEGGGRVGGPTDSRGTPPREKHGKMHLNDHILQGQSGDTNVILSNKMIRNVVVLTAGPPPPKFREKHRLRGIPP